LPTRPGSRNGAAEAERETISAEEFRRLRPQVEAFLETSFGRLAPECREEILNDAFLALHKARGRSPGSAAAAASAGAYLRQAAASLAIDRARRAGHPLFGAEPHDPNSRLLAELRAAGPSPEEQAEAALSDRQLRELAGALTPEEAGVVKRSVLWGWRPDDVMADLGLTRKRYERLRARALMKVARGLEEAGGELWARGKSRLIAALIAGTADVRQVKQARALAKQSAEFRLALAKYEATVHSVATAIPTEVAVRTEHRLGLADRAIALVDRARDAVGGVLGRGGDGAESAVAQQLGSGGARGAGAAGGGVLAKLGSSGIGAKAVVACLAGGAAATTCAMTGVLPGVRLGSGSPHSSPFHRAAQAEPPRAELAPPTSSVNDEPSPPPPDSNPAPTPPPAPAPTPTPTTTTPTTTTPIAPSTPPSEEEFGVASEATNTSSSGGGEGGGSPVRQEFGQP
jgi:DNA-directed RNA polymerase specialized sigma24 family protein